MIIANEIRNFQTPYSDSLQNSGPLNASEGKIFRPLRFFVIFFSNPLIFSKKKSDPLKMFHVPSWKITDPLDQEKHFKRDLSYVFGVDMKNTVKLIF